VVADGRSYEAQLPAVAAADVMDTDMRVTSQNEDTVIYHDGAAPTTI